MLRIAVCCDLSQNHENNMPLLHKLCLLQDIDETMILQIDNEKKLLETIRKEPHIDIWIMDVPAFVSMDMARVIREKNPGATLVFISDTTELAYEAFRVSAAQYYLKPMDPNEVFDFIQTVAAAQNRTKEAYFLFFTSKRMVKIPYSDIVYIESYDRKMTAHLMDGSTQRSKTIRGSFTESIKPLLADSRFLQSHKSYVLNMEHVSELKENTFVMEEGSVIPVPAYKAATAKAHYFQWAAQHGSCNGGGKRTLAAKAAKRVVIVSAAILLLLTALLNLSAELSASAYNIPIIGDVVRVLTFNRFQYDENGREADIKTPEIQGLLDSELQDRLNAEFAENARSLIQLFEETIIELTDLGDETARLSCMADYVVKTNNDKVLSVDTYLYSQVNNYQVHQFYTIAKESGRQVTLPRLFREDTDYITAISDWVLEEMQRRNLEENGTYTLTDSYFEPFTAISPNQHFYICEDGQLVICFDKYEVAAGVEGSPEFIIPADVTNALPLSEEFADLLG